MSMFMGEFQMEKNISYFIYAIYDVMNGKYLVYSDDYFLIKDYYDFHQYTENMGFKIEGVDINDYDNYLTVEKIKKGGERLC